MSLTLDKYLEHLKENRRGGIIENQYGWVLYAQPVDDIFFIEDISVYEDYRGEGRVVQLTDLAAQKAKELGCRYFITNIYPAVSGAAHMEEIVRKYGFSQGDTSKIIRHYWKAI